MNWFKKHTDAVIVLGGILAAVTWMNGKFNEIGKEFISVEKKFSSIENRIADVENRLTRIETIIYIKGLVSHELAIRDDKEK